MSQNESSFDALDIVFFVGGLITGVVFVAVLTGGAYAYYGVGLGFAGVGIRRALLPRAEPEVVTHPLQSSGRGILGAICLALGMVFAPLSGLVLLIFIAREVTMRDGKGLGFLAVTALVFGAAAWMLRFAFSTRRA